MAFTYHIDKTSRIVYLAGNPAGLEEWQRTMLAIFADPDYETGFSFLSDRRFMEEPRSTEFLRAALTFLKAHQSKLGRCKWASVVSTTAAYGMGRMVQILSEAMAIEVQVFTNLDEARAWLSEPTTLAEE